MKMNSWENWNFSAKAEERLKEISSQLKLENNLEACSLWLDLFNFNNPASNDCLYEMEVENSELSLKEENEICNLIKSSLETNDALEESRLVNLPHKSLNRILTSIKDILCEVYFSRFCKYITSWKNSVLIESSLKLIVLPKLTEKKESSSCTIYSVKELALKKPDKLCHNVFIPLFEDNCFQFNDVELMRNVIPVLQPEQQDLLILTLTKKENFQESDWLLLQSLITDLSKNSIMNIQECIQRFSSEFSKSTVFGKFLIHFCKNINFIINKNLLIEAIEKHETILKRQALKCLDSL